MGAYKVGIDPELDNAMAKKEQTSSRIIETAKKKRPGIHSKCKYSKLKSSKLYKKVNRGQG